MRRLPRFIRVIGHKVGVGVIKDLTHDNGDEADAHQFHRAYGVFVPDGPLIWLDKGNGPERMKSTLVHEALHAMLTVAHIEESSDEEELVGKLAPILLDFIRANRSAISYLQES
ncbi:MAG: hypothetical protein H0W36_05190 [Gemmatimonadetes bacterium]|nr:hypothetical protein [Gemmatimonadota bacterium]